MTAMRLNSNITENSRFHTSVTYLSTVDIFHRRFTEEEIYHPMMMKRAHEVRICTKNILSSLYPHQAYRSFFSKNRSNETSKHQ